MDSLTVHCYGPQTFTTQIHVAILSNHQNGRDTHVRRIKIRSPIQSSALLKLPKFTSPELT